MADDVVAVGDTGDDVARLVALTERQHELWNLLRDAADEATRNRVFDELTANRDELAKLKKSVSAQVDRPITRPDPAADPPATAEDQPRSVGEELRSRILSQPDDVAPPQPPPPPPAPPVAATPPPPAPPPLPVEPEPELTLPELDPVLPEPEPVSVEPVLPEPEPVLPEPEPVFVEPVVLEPEPVLSEPEPFVEPEPQAPSLGDEAPLAARSIQESSPTTEPQDPGADKLAPEKTPFPTREADLAATRSRKTEPSKSPAGKPRPVPDGVLEERRRHAHEAFQDMERVRSGRSRSFPVFAIFVAIAAVAVAVWYVFFFDSAESSGSTPTTTTIPLAADPTEQIEAVLDGLGVGSITVEARDGAIYVTGVVDSEDDRASVIGAAQALAGDMTVDGSGLTLGVDDDELRDAAIQAVADAGFERINVSVLGGVATLTGVTPDDGVTNLIGAVLAVDGIEDAVDLTETIDRAVELETELNRIIAVSPLVFESGQINLNALQQRTLDDAASAILAHSGPIVTIVGYTDAAGDAAENEQISAIRAGEVRDYLVQQGVSGDRLVVEGRGEDGASGSAAVAGLERRVEFEVGYAVPAGAEAGFRVGIVAPGARNDVAFTQSMVDAMNVVAAERGGVGIDISDRRIVTSDAEAAIRAYAADGYDLVIVHGTQYGTSLPVIATEYPDTAFAWGTAADTFDLPNVSAYEVAADEGGYVLGVVAALVSESKVVGVVGPLEIGDAQRFVDGFRAGAAAADPEVTVLTTYTGSFSDTTLAAEAAAAHIAAGADVLTGSGEMVAGAAGVAAENGVAWLGNQADQTSFASELVVASQVYHWEVAVRQIISGIDQGTLGGETYFLDLANGGVIVEYNSGYPLAADIAEIADTVTANIISGTVTTGS